MIYIIYNLLPIVVATLGGLALSYLMYRNSVSRQGMLSSGRPSQWLVWALAGEFWLACILAGALILAPVEAGVWTIAIGTALIIWIGFVVPATAINYRLRGLPVKTTVMDCGHWLGVMLIQVVLMRLIGLTGPTS